jgi:hypothetical protein
MLDATARSTADGRGGYITLDKLSVATARRALEKPELNPEEARLAIHDDNEDSPLRVHVESPLITAAAHAAANISLPTRGEATVETWTLWPKSANS